MLVSLSSVPLHATSSIKMEPFPAPKYALLKALAPKISANISSSDIMFTSDL